MLVIRFFSNPFLRMFCSTPKLELVLKALPLHEQKAKNAKKVLHLVNYFDTLTGQFSIKTKLYFILLCINYLIKMIKCSKEKNKILAFIFIMEY